MRSIALTSLAATLAIGAAFAATVPAQAADSDTILAGYLEQARQAEPGFAGFSADRGADLFRAPHAGGDAETPTCTSCHGQDPRGSGQNIKTGKAIEPMAVSANAKRYTDPADVEKWFRRNCNQVLGRECTAVEKGDFVTFMLSQ